MEDEFRREICAWLRANGVDPARTPMDPYASVADGVLTIRQKVSREGRDVVLPGGLGVLAETITVPVVVAPDARVAEWLLPRCPTCGR
jgi:hypothetical protein